MLEKNSVESVDVEEWISGEPTPDVVAAIAAELSEGSVSPEQTLSQIVKLITGLRSDFDTKIKYDESKEHTITLLHQELQDYRNDLNLTFLRPLAMEFVVLYDNMNKLVERYQVNMVDQLTEPVVKEVEGFLQDIEDSLARHGFEIYQTDSEQVDRASQQVQKTLSTSNPDLDRQIVRRLRKGLRYGERVLRPEGVSAYRYSEPTSDSEKA